VSAARRSGALLAAALLGLAAAVAGEGGDPFGVAARVRDAGTARAGLDVTFRVPPGHLLYAQSLAVESGGAALALVEAPPPVWKADPVSGERMAVYEHDATLRYRLPAGAPLPVRVEAAYQGCNDTLCFPPRRVPLLADEQGSRPAEDRAGRPAPDAGAGGWRERLASFRVAGKAAGYLNAREFLRFLDATKRGEAPGNALAEAFRTRGRWVALLSILAGGFLLNFTPCVLPMIPVNLAIIGAGTRAASRRRGFVLGAVYGLGIAAVYGVLGLAAVLTGARFGALNSAPWFNLGIAAVFAALALGMFGVWNIDFSRWQPAGGRLGAGGTLAAAFALGGLAALLAGACVAPVVVSVLLLAADWHSRGIGAGLLLPFLLGVGMALPWPLAGAGLALLPKPGRWMNAVKYGFGAIILALAVWYGHLGYRLWRDRPQRGAAAAAAADRKAAGEEGWLTSLAEGLRIGAAERKPVFVDFWASWCKNCAQMDRTTFRDAAVRARLDGYVRVKVRAEDMAAPGVKELLDYFEVPGLPTYVVLRPREGGEG